MLIRPLRMPRPVTCNSEGQNIRISAKTQAVPFPRAERETRRRSKSAIEKDPRKYAWRTPIQWATVHTRTIEAEQAVPQRLGRLVLS
jgi:hypothetical protein